MLTSKQTKTGLPTSVNMQIWNVAMKSQVLERKDDVNETEQLQTAVYAKVKGRQRIHLLITFVTVYFNMM